MVRPISTFLPALLLLVASFGLSACDLGFDDTNPDMELPASADNADQPDVPEDSPEDLPVDPPEDGTGGSCTPAVGLQCGGVVTANTEDAYAESSIDSYSCSDWDATGPEVAFSFEAPSAGTFTATILGAGNDADLDIYILGEEGTGCDASSCIAFGDQEASWEGVESGIYYIVVDGYLGDAGPFTLELTCGSGEETPDPDPDPEPEPEPDPEDSPSCSAASVLACASSSSSDTTGALATDAMDGYSCVGWDASGPEVVYSFVATSTGVVTAALTMIEPGQDLDIYVLSQSCDSESCIAYGNYSTEFDAIEGETYYLVVDGYYGDAGEYSLEVSCAGPGVAADAIGFATCDNSLSDDTTVGANAIDGYGCNSWDASGPELVYSLTAESAGEITATLSGMNGQDLDVYIVPDLGNGLDPSACSSYGNWSATWTAAAGESFYVVVDGFLGDSGSFDLTLSCPQPGEDLSHCLDWSSANVAQPGYFVSLLSSFGIDVTSSSILLSATDIDPASGEIEMTMGTAQPGTCAQDLTVPTTNLTAGQAGTYGAGSFEVGPTTSSVRLGTIDYPIYNLVVEGEYSLDGSTITDASFEGELDVSNLYWQGCAFALNCYPCPQGNGQCIAFEVDSAELSDNGAGALQLVP